MATLRRCLLAILCLLSGADCLGTTITAVEYYHAGFNHYFITAFTEEIAALDAGAFGGAWSRTGQTFSVWAEGNGALSPVCRFFSSGFGSKSSHFYTPYPAECATLKTNPLWQYEAVAFYLALPVGSSPGNQTCPSDMLPLYRLYNNGMGGAPNHRYTTSTAIFNQMTALGWAFEGQANTKVFACIPATVPGTVAPPPIIVPGTDYSTAFTGDETGETTFTLTGSKPTHLDVNEHIDLPATTELWAFTAAEYSVKIYALDATNAQLLLNGAPFSGYLLSFPEGGTGMNFVTLPAGRYWIGTIAGQTVFPTYSNRVYHEVSYHALPKWRQIGNVPLGTGAKNPGGWTSRGFTVPSGAIRAFIETEGMGGIFAIMSNEQFASFSSTFANGYFGGTFYYTYACGGTNGAADLEIECEMKLPPGGYSLVYINTTGSVSGGAGNIEFYAP